MRISDWSSDVCSSDLEHYLRLGAHILGKAKVVANSEATRLVTKETGWRHIDVVSLATDLSGPPPSGRSEPYILFAGRLVERKGCAWFIRNEIGRAHV